MIYRNNRIIDCLHGLKIEQIPVWIMRQAGRHLPQYRMLRQKEPDFMSFVENAELTTQAALEPIEKYDLDAAILFSDILTIPHWMGWPVKFVSGYGIEIPAVDTESMEHLSLSKLRDNLEYLHDSMYMLRNHIIDRPIIGFAGAPWTLACYLLDKSKNQFTNARRMLIEKPIFMQQLMQKLTHGILMSIDTQIKAGADIIMLFDSWAGLLSPNDYKKFCLPYIQTIRQHLSDCNRPFIFFAKGQSYSTQISCRPTCITLDWTQEWPKNPLICTQGGFDPALLLTTEATIEHIVNVQLSQNGHAHYIANLGHGILPETPPDNVLAFIHAVRQFKPNQQ